jgi:hypothetical protein
MAEAGLFIGWGPPVRGREAKGLEVFNQAISFFGDKQESGAIESQEAVLIGPHGGDLYGFILLRATEDQIAELRADGRFQRLTTRAGLIVERLGVVDAVVDEGLGEAVSRLQEAIAELA